MVRKIFFRHQKSLRHLAMTLTKYSISAHLGAPRRGLRGDVMVTCHGTKTRHGNTLKSHTNVMVFLYRWERDDTSMVPGEWERVSCLFSSANYIGSLFWKHLLTSLGNIDWEDYFIRIGSGTRAYLPSDLNARQSTSDISIGYLSIWSMWFTGFPRRLLDSP